MKNYFFIAAAAILFASCNQEQLDQSAKSNDSLTDVVGDRDAAINDFIIAFNDVERNLDSVAIRQHLITVTTDKGELKITQKERINAEIVAINDLMDQNRKKLAELSRKLKNSGNKNVQLEKTIATMNDQLAQKDIELNLLNERLTSLNAQVVQLQTNVTTLTDESNAKSETINETTTALHTAYYVIGKSKELQDANLIDRKGGLLGMGKTSKVRGDLDNSKFTRIDYTQTTSIIVDSKMKLISSHPTDSYTLNKDEKNKDVVSNIIITNPEKFWSVTKYLVIMKD